MGMEFDETFQDRFKELRKEKNLTQGEIAEELGVSKASVAMWETGKRTPPLRTLHQIAEYFDCRLDYLLGTSDDRWTSYYEYEEAVESAREATEAEATASVTDYYEDILRKIAMLDTYGKRMISRVLDTEYSRCREQNTVIEDTSWLQITIRVNPKKLFREEKETVDDVGVDMDEYWEWENKREQAWSEE